MTDLLQVVQGSQRRVFPCIKGQRPTALAFQPICVINPKVAHDESCRHQQHSQYRLAVDTPLQL